MSIARTAMVLGTRNRGKLAEFRKLLEDLPIDLLGLSDVMPELPPVSEDGTTFEQNATKKAKAIAEATLMVTLADDSGLEVDALGGAPGVRSARFAGERPTDAENNAALLKALEEVPEEARTARFRCVLCLVDPWTSDDGSLCTVHGVCEGSIASSPRGGGGFGYDPLFIVRGDRHTMAELSDEQKNSISHRARAIQALGPHLQSVLQARQEVTDRVSLHHPLLRP
jgi:XTP/dITP diphosphohydrolase